MHRPVPGTVYDSDSDLSRMDPLYTPLSLPARTSPHPLWPDTTGHILPGHLTPGAPCLNYLTPHLADTSSVYGLGDYDLNHSDQLLHQDWTTQGAQHMQIEQLAEQPHPCISSDFKLDSTREDNIPWSDISQLPPVSHNFRDPWFENWDLLKENLTPCDPLAWEAAIREHLPQDVLNPFEPYFDIQSVLPIHYEGPSDSRHMCKWTVGGSQCNEYYLLGNNLKHSVSQHLSKVHNLRPAGGKSIQRCLWVGCTKELKQESILRHILTVHLHITTACQACGTSFARQDSLQRHIRNSCAGGMER